MKTDSSKESACQLLASWKSGQTFSEVIERLIPPKGTIRAALERAANLPELAEGKFDQLERTVEATRAPMESAWS